MARPKKSSPAKWREIGKRIRAARDALGLSQVAVCKLIAMQPSAYNQWESGAVRPDPDNAERFCDAIGVTLDWIYRGRTEGLPASFWKQLGPAMSASRRSAGQD